jgi:hypothetical protein
MTTVTAAGAEREHKAYAATTNTRALAPDFGEMGLPALSFSPLARFFSPKGTPKDITIKLNAATFCAARQEAEGDGLTQQANAVPSGGVPRIAARKGTAESAAASPNQGDGGEHAQPDSGRRPGQSDRDQGADQRDAGK